MLDISAEQKWSFGDGGWKRIHAGADDFERAGPGPKNH
jgi:hypothetical protein